MHMALWKRVLLAVIMFAGIYYALPNLFYNRVEAQNDAQLRIEKNLEAETESGTELEALGAWPGFLSSKLVNLGLDLRGGVHLVVAVALESVHADRLDLFWTSARDALRLDRERFGELRRIDHPSGGFAIRIGNPAEIEAAAEIVRAQTQRSTTLTGATSSDFEITVNGEMIEVAMSNAEIERIDEQTMARSLEIIRRRIDAAGTREPTIIRQGDDRILIEVPGFGSTDEVLRLIGRTAKLTFHPVIGLAASVDERAGTDELVFPGVKGDPSIYRLSRTPVVSGDMLTDSQMQFDQNNRPAVSFRFDPNGARKFGDYTAAHINEPFAIVLDEEVISAPTIQSYIGGGSGIITGNFTVEEAQELAVLLRSGALPAEITVLEQNVIGPDLGQDSIDAGSFSAMISLIAVVLYMFYSYRSYGLFADIGLIINIVLIVAAMSLIGATLTLPGIAGIVLTMGMAVDANVLIYERIREEMRGGSSLNRAIDIGFEKAQATIMDANVTALIAAVTLYWLGAGPVRGFAITLILGIFTSVITAVYLSRWLIILYVDYFRPKTLPF